MPNGAGVSTIVNGGAPRMNNRRRDSQRPGETAGRQNRNGKAGQQEILDRRLQKRKPEPYGMSLSLHLCGENPGDDS